MLKGPFLLLSLSLLGGVGAQAQIVDGSFSGGLSGWTALGVPTVESTYVPSDGSASSALLLESTNNTTDTTFGDPGPLNSQNADSAQDIENTLDVTLASTGFLGRDNPTNGEAIFQKFSVSAATTLSFEWAYATYDGSPYDSVGYVIGNASTGYAYHELEATPIDSQPTPSGYQTAVISVPLGNDTLAFVAYNTGDETHDTSLYVTDVALAPEPPAWLLVMGSLVLLVGCGWKFRPVGVAKNARA